MNHLRRSTSAFVTITVLYYFICIFHYQAVGDWQDAVTFIGEVWSFALSAVILDNIRQSTVFVTLSQ